MSAVSDALRRLLAGYNRSSLVALGILVATYVAVGLIWNRYLDLASGDNLLLGIWVFMTALLCWDIQPRRELIRAAVGLAGGLTIEAWGTVTDIWWYFTAERPPIWILPAWPVAAISIDRLARALDRVLPPGSHRTLWWLLMPPFVVLMTAFVWPYAGHPFTIAAIIAMVAVLVWPGNTRQDVALMLGGAGLGVFLEYWGTSRQCWNYYTLQTPPIAAALAHGFASVAFQRVAALIDPVARRLELRYFKRS